jgi:hypothetical protein
MSIGQAGVSKRCSCSCAQFGSDDDIRAPRAQSTTKELLRQAAIETMNEKGFTAMTIQDIADRANVN